MQCKGLLTSAIAVLVAVGLGAPAGANLDNNELGAAVAVPYLTSDYPNDVPGTETVITVTNAKSTGIVLRIRVIEGPTFQGFGKFEGPVDGRWAIESYSCALTGNETVLFVVDSIDFNRAEIASSSLSCNVTRRVNAEAGIIFFAVDGDDGNALFADWAVVDFDRQFAFGAEAISFQAGGDVNTDENYVFDGTEYSQFPSVLSTNFLFGDDLCSVGSDECRDQDGEVRSEGRSAALMLFTLDGRTGNPPPVEVKIDYYNQFEEPQNAFWAFSCFTFIDLWKLSPNLNRQVQVGSEAGHMILKASEQVRTPFHGWIVQQDFEAERPGMWARTLAQNTGNFVPEEGGNVILGNQ